MKITNAPLSPIAGLTMISPLPSSIGLKPNLPGPTSGADAFIAAAGNRGPIVSGNVPCLRGIFAHSGIRLSPAGDETDAPSGSGFIPGTPGGGGSDDDDCGDAFDLFKSSISAFGIMIGGIKESLTQKNGGVKLSEDRIAAVTALAAVTQAALDNAWQDLDPSPNSTASLREAIEEMMSYLETAFDIIPSDMAKTFFSLNKAKLNEALAAVSRRPTERAALLDKAGQNVLWAGEHSEYMRSDLKLTALPRAIHYFQDASEIWQNNDETDKAVASLTGAGRLGDILVEHVWNSGDDRKKMALAAMYERSSYFDRIGEIYGDAGRNSEAKSACESWLAIAERMQERAREIGEHRWVWSFEFVKADANDEIGKYLGRDSIWAESAERHLMAGEQAAEVWRNIKDDEGRDELIQKAFGLSVGAYARASLHWDMMGEHIKATVAAVKRANMFSNIVDPEPRAAPEEKHYLEESYFMGEQFLEHGGMWSDIKEALEAMPFKFGINRRVRRPLEAFVVHFYNVLDMLKILADAAEEPARAARLTELAEKLNVHEEWIKPLDMSIRTVDFFRDYTEASIISVTGKDIEDMQARGPEITKVMMKLSRFPF